MMMVFEEGKTKSREEVARVVFCNLTFTPRSQSHLLIIWLAINRPRHDGLPSDCNKSLGAN